MSGKELFDYIVGLANIIGAAAAVVAVYKTSLILKVLRSDTNYIEKQTINVSGSDNKTAGRDVS